jgi:hypothetical protein
MSKTIYNWHQDSAGIGSRFISWMIEGDLIEIDDEVWEIVEVNNVEQHFIIEKVEDE